MAVYQADVYVELRDATGDRFWYGLFDESFRSAFTWEEAKARVSASLQERFAGSKYENLRRWLDRNAFTPSLELWGVWQRS